MVSNSAKLDHRTKQHTQFGVSASNGSRDMARTKSWRRKRKKKKNNEANCMISNSAKLQSSTLNLESLRVTVPEISRRQNRGGKKKKKKRKKRKKNEHRRNYIASPTGIVNNNNIY